MSQGFQYYIIFTNQLLIYPKFISNIINIIERKVHKFNTLHLKCFTGLMQQSENLVFVELSRFLFSIDIIAQSKKGHNFAILGQTEKKILVRLFFVLMLHIKFQVPSSSSSVVLQSTKG